MHLLIIFFADITSPMIRHDVLGKCSDNSRQFLYKSYFVSIKRIVIYTYIIWNYYSMWCCYFMFTDVIMWLRVQLLKLPNQPFQNKIFLFIVIEIWLFDLSWNLWLGSRMSISSTLKFQIKGGGGCVMSGVQNNITLNQVKFYFDNFKISKKRKDQKYEPGTKFLTNGYNTTFSARLSPKMTKKSLK